MRDRHARIPVRAWQDYVAQFRERMGAIATAAQEVCTREELELLGADLLEWPEERIADHLGLSAEALRARRVEIHEKIREAIGSERVEKLSRRRRDNKGTTGPAEIDREERRRRRA